MALETLVRILDLSLMETLVVLQERGPNPFRAVHDTFPDVFPDSTGLQGGGQEACRLEGKVACLIMCGPSSINEL